MNKKLAYLIPNFFTAGSLICALMALNLIAEGHFVMGAWLITISLLFDGLDGKVARWLHATSKIGAEADSLADFVAFGVVPGFLAWSVSLRHYGTIGFLVFMIYVLCGGYRLARFNVMAANSAKKEDFKGLPIPAAAATIASFILFQDLIIPNNKHDVLLLFILCFLSWLMVSKIPYFAVTKAHRRRKTTTMLIICIATLVYWAIRYTVWVYLICSWIYICSGLYRQAIIIIKKYQKKCRVTTQK